MRHIGIWESNGKETVGELVIDGNKIEFYNRNLFDKPTHIFLPKGVNEKFLVFTDGHCDFGSQCNIDHAISYYVRFVLESNTNFNINQLNNITRVTFTFPELKSWLQLATVDFCVSDAKQATASMKDMDYFITLKEKNPSIYIYFSEKTSIQGFQQKPNNVTFSQSPAIAIEYDSPTIINNVFSDIEAVLQFFSLIIGYVSEIENVELFFGKNMQPRQHRTVYFNHDFSYNMGALYCYKQTRCIYKDIEDNLTQYFENWYDFFYNKRYDLIRKMYFCTNNRKQQVVSDEFVQYVRILEGYYLRYYNEEQKSKELINQINIVKKEIKKLIMSEDGKAVFEPALGKALPEWNFNSKHADEVANWIATGFLERKCLSEKLKELDLQFFNVISQNADAIKKIGNEPEKAFNYYRAISDTRNYFAHYKETKDDVMNFHQMLDTIKTLKALMTMILFSHMGMDKSDIRHIIMQDMELRNQTQYLSN